MVRSLKIFASLVGVLCGLFAGPANVAGYTIQLQTKGKTFAPAVYCTTTPDTFLWSWADGTTSSTFPIVSKTFTNAAIRTQYLTVSPADLLTNFNIGYDASDWGDTSNYVMRAQQNVNAIYFLEPLTNLQYWASSYNPITNVLNFSGFTSVRDIECWHCTNLQHVVVTNLPLLRRANFERCNLQELDLSGNPNFEDLRCALNAYTNIVVANGTGPKIWHFCVRDNPQITEDFKYIMTNFYSLREPWFWNANQRGGLRFVSSNLTDVEISNNQYNYADFTGQSNMFELQIFGNILTNLIIDGCTALQDFEANANHLPGNVIDHILAVLDTSCPNVSLVKLDQQSGFLSATGFTNYSHLTNRGVTVTVDLPTFHGPVLALDSHTLLGEACIPANGVVDPGETVTMSFALKNSGFSNTTNLMVKLLATNGIASPSGTQAYGVLVGGGPAVSHPFTFTAAAPCGGTIVATFQLTDGAANLGTLTQTINLGTPNLLYSQNFDDVASPALPTGWTTSATNAGSPWATVTSPVDTSPNSVFCRDATNVGLTDLVSPPLAIPAGFAQLTFANYYDLEAAAPPAAYDGGVLEIKIGSGAFADILAAGGSFAANGYTHTISSSFANPLAGRQAWSGSSGGFIQTAVNLPSAAANQIVQFRWRCGTDNGNASVGWRIDSIGITTNGCCTNSVPTLPVQNNRSVIELAKLMVTNTATSLSQAPGGLSYNLLNPPAGVTIDPAGVISWTPMENQGPGTNTITTVAFDAVTPLLTATNSFQVVVYESNQPPILPPQFARTVFPPFTLTITNSATDTDFPVNGLTYTLQGPASATIDGSGVITWDVQPSDAPSTNLLTTIVTDSNPWAINAQHLSATNSFLVTVSSPAVSPPPPMIRSIVVSNGVASIVCQTVAGLTYRLQSKDDFNDTNWTDLPPDLAAFDSLLTLTNQVDVSTQRFYRIFVVP